MAEFIQKIRKTTDIAKLEMARKRDKEISDVRKVFEDEAAADFDNYKANNLVRVYAEIEKEASNGLEYYWVDLTHERHRSRYFRDIVKKHFMDEGFKMLPSVGEGLKIGW